MNSSDLEGNGSQAALVPIVLVDDHDVWREGVKSMLMSTEFIVVGEASSGAEAPGVVEACKPRIVLMDIRMEGGDGFAALTVIKSRFPQVLVLMLTTYSTPTFMARAIAGGASGYLTKGLKRSELLETLRAIASGGTLLSREEIERSLQYVNELQQDAAKRGGQLAFSEIELLRMLVAGSSDQEIAAALSVTTETAGTFVEQIVGKLGVSDRIQAAVWAIKNGVI